MSIKNWPLSDRPREKLLHKGAESLSDAEILAIFLRTGSKKKSAVDVARDLISQFGDLRSIFEADIKEFSKADGLGKVKYIQLQAILEMSQRYLFEKIKTKETINNSAQINQYLISKFGNKKQEIFGALFLDTKHHIIDFKELFKGSTNYAHIYPREIVKIALDYHATAVIFAHNHPSGDPTPSQADIQLTQKLKNALSIIEVKVLDHIIVGKNKTVSLMNQRMI